MFSFLVLAWANLALYWSNIPWAWLRVVLAIAFSVFGIYALWWKRSPRTYLVFGGLFLAVVVLYVSIQPSFNRPWQTDVTVLPQAIRDGDRVLLKNFRNFDCRSTTDFTPHYESREVGSDKLRFSLEQLNGSSAQEGLAGVSSRSSCAECTAAGQPSLARLVDEGSGDDSLGQYESEISFGAIPKE